ncbi:MAG: small multi-drug export protein [Clostridiales bacterium]|jgi:uncharacterized membrane protein|nr:small multi-drug export protein [Clostridiales bacterium]
MHEMMVTFLQSNGIPAQAIIFIISLLPIFELRAGLIAAAMLGLDPLESFVICYIANILPIPLILIFIKAIFAFMKKHGIFARLIERLEASALKKSVGIMQKQYWGLFLFVAIPLPGTGGWTGALIASLLNMPVKKSFFAIAAGVFGAGVIMLLITYFAPGIFGFEFKNL